MFASPPTYAAAYTSTSPSRDDELTALFKWISAQPGDELMIVGPAAKSLEHSELAAKIVRQRLADYSSIRQRRWLGIDRIIALWPCAEDLQKLHDSPKLKALAVATWTPEWVQTWAIGTRALDLTTGTNATTATSLDVLVLGGLRAITDIVNISSGLTNSSDYNHAINVFESLRTFGCALNGTLVEQWAIANGWSARHAKTLGDLASDIGAGKTKRMKSGGVRTKPTANMRQRWQEKGSDAEWKPH